MRTLHEVGCRRFLWTGHGHIGGLRGCTSREIAEMAAGRRAIKLAEMIQNIEEGLSEAIQYTRELTPVGVRFSSVLGEACYKADPHPQEPSPEK
jgi:hypothetical protein